MAISTLSVISCRMTRGRPAPIAIRRAISRARSGRPARNSPATLAHATNSTAPGEHGEHRQQDGDGRRIRDPVLQLGAHDDAPIAVRLRVGAFQIRGNDGQLGLRLGDRRAGLEASLDGEAPEIARLERPDIGSRP